ncbi:hypothetical protein [Carnimonas bestiolae]|uniref:hypothetical protein n=1 Tax=Carnimonas bestiolae TaxID=3402172 RepID=UPI003F4AA221
MEIDRKLQNKILQELKELEHFRQPMDINYMTTNFIGQEGFRDPTRQHVLNNMFYLGEHGLITIHPPNHCDDDYSFSITAEGVDFISDDGGLTAILGVVTVRLHADTIRDLVASKINESDAPEEEKSWMRKALATMNEEGYRTLSKNLMEYAWENKAIAWQGLKVIIAQSTGG